MLAQVLVYLPYPYTGSGSSYTPIAIAREFPRQGLPARTYVPSARARLPADLVARTWVPQWLPRPIRGGRFHHWASAAIVDHLVAEVQRLGPGTPVWLWPCADLDAVRRLKDAGAFLVREMINTHGATFRRIMIEEEARSGLLAPFNLSAADIAKEDAELALVDRVVSPSVGVDQSLLDGGIASEKIYRSHFGWEPARFPDRSRRPAGTAFKALFVGDITIRKGAHLALAAWREADIDGEFHLVGRLSPEMAPLVAQEVARGRVIHHTFTASLSDHYRSAHCLFFPTLEEGAPLVCYEAAAFGTPILTGPMGAARLVEHERSGLVFNPLDHCAMVAALRLLAGDAALHEHLAAGARTAADCHRWEDAARHRLALLQADQANLHAKPLFSRV